MLGLSERNQRRQRAKNVSAAASMAGMKNLLHYFSKEDSTSTAAVDRTAVSLPSTKKCQYLSTVYELSILKDRIKSLEAKYGFTENQAVLKKRKKSLSDSTNLYIISILVINFYICIIIDISQEMWGLCVLRYFNMIIIDGLDSKKRVASSIKIAEVIVGKGSYASRTIRKQADYYYMNQKLWASKKGRFVKVKSLILEEDCRSAAREYFQSLRATMRTAEGFQSWVNSGGLLEMVRMNRVGFAGENDDLDAATARLPTEINISLQTAKNWLQNIGFSFGRVHKGINIDGHEREDVVNYRQQFLVTFSKYRERMSQYKDGESKEMEQIIQPAFYGMLKNVVLVVHDECIFYSNDGHSSVWHTDNGKKEIIPKGEGKCIMVSDFLCPCHGHLKLKVPAPDLIYQEARVIIEPGKNSDGYWKGVNVVEQLYSRAIPIFKKLHGDGCEALFLFDNSTNHGVYPPDALRATKLNLTDGFKKKGGVEQTDEDLIRDAWYLKDGEKVVQKMYKPYGLHQNYFNGKRFSEALTNSTY